MFDGDYNGVDGPLWRMETTDWETSAHENVVKYWPIKNNILFYII